MAQNLSKPVKTSQLDSRDSGGAACSGGGFASGIDAARAGRGELRSGYRGETNTGSPFGLDWAG